jgi:hyperosmotically inducible periplasmic protein
MMNRISWKPLLASALLFASVGSLQAADPATTNEAKKSAPDDSGRNARDREGSTLTPGDQGDSEADVAATREIRKAIVDDDTLSITAQNVKIITLEGIVTLRGPVKSQDEKQRIAAAAEKVAGSGKVQNHLEIAQ